MITHARTWHWCGHIAVRLTRIAGVGPDYCRTWHANHNCFGQRHRIYQHAILQWVQNNGIDWHYIAPGKPQQNAYIESFNGKLRDEGLNEILFVALADAKETLKEWSDDYNQQRPHSSLENLTPQEFAEKKTLDKLAA